MNVRMASLGARSLFAAFLLKTFLHEGASAEPLTQCLYGSASLRLLCAQSSLIWVKWGFYGIADDLNFCSRPVVNRGKDCLPNEQGHTWAIATDCNLFSSCLTFYGVFKTEAGLKCKTRGPIFSQVDYECLSRFKSDSKTLIDYIYLSTEATEDVVDEKMFLMSDRYTSSTSGETGHCQIKLPAMSSARFQLLDLRGRTNPETTERCPYKLYIYSGVKYKEWCAAGSSFVSEEYWIERRDSESVIDVVFTRVVPNANGAVWLLMEGKRADGKLVTGMKVNCGRAAVLQNLEDRKTTRETTTRASTSEAARKPEGQSAASGGLARPDDVDGGVYYIFKSTMAAKVPGADGVIDSLAIARDSKGTDPVLRMSAYSRDFGQQWFLDGQRIRNRFDSKCMAVNEQKQLVLADCKDSDRTQAWDFQKDLGMLQNVELGDVIEVTNNLPNSGAALGVGPNKDARHQKFIFEEAPKYFTIVSRANGTVATLSSVTERSKILMQPETEPLKDNQVFYHDKKNVIRTKVNNFGLDTRSGTVVAARFLGVNKDNNWTYNGTLSKIVSGGESSSNLRVLQMKFDMTLAIAKSSGDANQGFDIRYVD